MTEFALIVPTLNPGSIWEKWVDGLLSQSIKPARVLIIDSGSTDNTLHICNSKGFEVVSIKKSEFNHGGTRQLALQYMNNVEFVIYMTQDAILANEDSISNILQPFKDTMVAAVCGRQLPHMDAGPIGSHARLFTYSDTSFTRTIKDVHHAGLKTAFLSDSFAAYRVSALSEVGGFPENVIYGEDMFVAAKILKAGHNIVYAANACVYHSHDYSIIQEMKRYFDMGVFHAREPWIRAGFGGAEKEGVKFVVSEFKYLSQHAFWRIPEGMLRTALRYIGFRLGLLEKHIPLIIKKKISMNSYYFKGA